MIGLHETVAESNGLTSFDKKGQLTELESKILDASSHIDTDTILDTLKELVKAYPEYNEIYESVKRDSIIQHKFPNNICDIGRFKNELLKFINKTHQRIVIYFENIINNRENNSIDTEYAWYSLYEYYRKNGSEAIDELIAKYNKLGYNTIAKYCTINMYERPKIAIGSLEKPIFPSID